MNSARILSPFYLDEYMPGLEEIKGESWILNKPKLPAGSNQTRMSVIYKDLANLVAQISKRGEKPISIAGDCCTTIGVLAGLQRTSINPLLIWFDAHGDFNTWETTPSGFLGGMPLAMLVGRGEQTMPEAVKLRSMPEEDVILTDTRDLDPGEKTSLEQSSVTVFSDPKKILDMNIPDRPLYVHFDTDILDPRDAPAMNYAAPGGPRAKDIQQVFRHLSSSHKIIAASLSSWNPKLDIDGSTKEICMALFDELAAN